MTMTHTISNIIDLTNAPTPPRWFEFLLEPGRLQQHLGTSACDPSPTQLISLFFRNTPIIESNTTNQSPSQRNGSNNVTTNGNSGPVSGQGTSSVSNNEPNKSDAEPVERVLIDYNGSTEISIPPDSYEAKYRTKKAYALQVLSLKVASFLKWDLNVLCNNLSIPIQHKLMQALVRACDSEKCPVETKVFASLTYCHWFIRSAITYRLSTLQPQSSNATIIYLSQLQQQQQAAESSALLTIGELFAPGSEDLISSCTELQRYISDLSQKKAPAAKKLKTTGHPFKKAKLCRPSVDCFDSRDEKFTDWDKCEAIEPVEFLETACFDLGRFFFFEESYQNAKQCFELIKTFKDKFPKLSEYLQSATELASPSEDTTLHRPMSEPLRKLLENRDRAEKYLYDCMKQYKKQVANKERAMDLDELNAGRDDNHEGDRDLRFERQYQRLPEGNDAWYNKVAEVPQQQQIIESVNGDAYMSQGHYKEAMGCFVGALMIMTDYFRNFSKNYVNEEPYITRMIQCSISLSCFTQAVALCQMTKTLNYTIAFKQLNERVCNDCCDDIYECLWDITLLEYIINLHTKRGEVERRTKVIQLVGQLELNENNPEHILREAEHVRRGRFFRIMSNKYL